MRRWQKNWGICIDTLRSWLKASVGVSTGQAADRQNREARRLREREAEVRALRKQVAEKDEVISGASVEELCQALAIPKQVTMHGASVSLAPAYSAIRH